MDAERECPGRSQSIERCAQKVRLVDQHDRLVGGCPAHSQATGGVVYVAVLLLCQGCAGRYNGDKKNQPGQSETENILT